MKFLSFDNQSFKNFDYLKLYSLITFLIICLLFSYNFHENRLYPSHIDESSYFLGVKSFTETGSLKAVLSINEERSKVGGFNWYGPVIQFIYGKFSQFFGFNNLSIIILNFVFFIASVLIIRFLYYDLNDFFKFSSVFLSVYISFSFIFTYFPENLIVLLSLTLLHVFLKTYKNKKNVILFVVLVLLFSFVRMTLIFWIFGILFYESFKIRNRIFLILITFLVGVFYMKLFTAPSSISGLGDIHNSNDSFNLIHVFKNLSSNFYTNLYRLFDRINSSIIIFLILFLLSCLSIYQQKKEDVGLLLGLLMIVIFSFFAFLILYSTYWFFFEKQIAFTFPILIFIIVQTKIQFKNVVYMSIFIFFPISFTKTRDLIINKKKAFTEVEINMRQIFERNKFKDFLKTDNDVINVLFDRNDFNLSQDIIISTLPSSVNQKPILYTSSVCKKESSDDRKFKLYGKLKIDYCISTKELNIMNFKLVYNNNYINLYKIIK